MEKVIKRIIKIPFAPPSLNEYARFNRWQLHRCHKDWKQAVWALCNQSTNKVPKPCRRVKITKATIYFISKRRRDETNYSATLWKLFLDGLVVAEIIPDDTSNFITVPGRVDFVDNVKTPETIVEMDCYLC